MAVERPARADGPSRSRPGGMSPTRRALGSWLEGPPRLSPGYPGERLRLPETGRGSVASFGEKLVALLIDLVISSLVGLVIVRPHTLAEQRDWNFVSVLVFVVLSSLMLLASGTTVGQRVMKLQVVRLDGRRMGLRSLPRQVLVALLVPAVIVDRDRRGLHDRLCGTLVVRVR